MVISSTIRQEQVKSYLMSILITQNGGSSSGDTIILIVNANENISAYVVVTADGYNADSSNVQHRNRILGISNQAISNGFTGNVVANGKIQNSSWTWNPGDKIFLNGTSLSTTAPNVGFCQVIGVAYQTDTIDVQIKQGILL